MSAINNVSFTCLHNYCKEFLKIVLHFSYVLCSFQFIDSTVVVSAIAPNNLSDILGYNSHYYLNRLQHFYFLPGVYVEYSLSVVVGVFIERISTDLCYVTTFKQLLTWYQTNIEKSWEHFTLLISCEEHGHEWKKKVSVVSRHKNRTFISFCLFRWIILGLIRKRGIYNLTAEIDNYTKSSFLFINI